MNGEDPASSRQKAIVAVIRITKALRQMERNHNSFFRYTFLVFRFFDLPLPSTKQQSMSFNCYREREREYKIIIQRKEKKLKLHISSHDGNILNWLTLKNKRNAILQIPRMKSGIRMFLTFWNILIRLPIILCALNLSPNSPCN